MFQSQNDEEEKFPQILPLEIMVRGNLSSNVHERFADETTTNDPLMMSKSPKETYASKPDLREKRRSHAVGSKSSVNTTNSGVKIQPNGKTQINQNKPLTIKLKNVKKASSQMRDGDEVCN